MHTDLNKTDAQAYIPEVAAAFRTQGELTEYRPYGNGHINDTFLVRCTQDGLSRRYVLQRMNHEIFKDPLALMQNIKNITDYMKKRIAERGGDPSRETLNLVPLKDDSLLYQDAQGFYWRMFLFVEDSVTFEQVENAEDFYRSGRAFGHFQMLLAEYPAQNLTETIAGFHDTPARFAAFQRAVAEDVCERAHTAQEEIAFLLARESELSAAMDMLQEGKLPLRVTHNDTKLNNILFDARTKDALCIIDLDTVMPGLSIFDFGDSIRFGANTAAEDERDVGRVSLSLELFESYTKGFLESCGEQLTPQEVRMLPMGAKLMTLECGMRFLADYLQGDVYFHTACPEHNLIRCRTQLALVADMEQKWEAMKAIVKKYGHGENAPHTT